MNRTQTLDAARSAVTGQREQDYGVPENHFGQIAAMWTAYLDGGPIRPVDVPMMMGMLKMARIRTSPAHFDSFVDMAGYAACGAEIGTARWGEDAAPVITPERVCGNCRHRVMGDHCISGGVTHMPKSCHAAWPGPCGSKGLLWEAADHG